MKRRRFCTLTALRSTRFIVCEFFFVFVCGFMHSCVYCKKTSTSMRLLSIHIRSVHDAAWVDVNESNRGEKQFAWWSLGRGRRR